MKKLASLLLAVVMVLSMTVAAFAENEETGKGEGDFTITLTNKNPGHSYTAYQIFKGDLLVENKGEITEKKTLSNIEWGDNVDTTKTITVEDESDPTKTKALTLFNAINDVLSTNFDSNASARDVAEALAKKAGNGKDAETTQAFVKTMHSFLQGTGKESDAITGDFKGTYTISSLNAGYYLVEDTRIGNQEGDAYSRYIMEVVADVKAEVKAEGPTIDKKIVVDDERVESNTAAIDQKVYYELTGKVPDYTGYDKYFYVITDTLSKGLTFNDDIKVTIGGKELTKFDSATNTGDYYLYTTDYSKTDGTTFEIALVNIQKYTIGNDVVVTYSATVNENAEIGNSTGNLNTVNLTYSNNPNFKYDGKEKPDKPGTPKEDTPTGVTPDKKTLTFVAEIKIHKVDENNNNLAGATFTLTGISKQIEQQIVTEFVEDPDGTYYKLKDGSYTTEEPHGEIQDPVTGETIGSNEDSYEDTTKKYKLQEKTVLGEYLVKKELTATSDDKGIISFRGLGAGVYTIEETGVPAGYNKAPDVIVEIKCEIPSEVTTGEESAKWSVGNLTSTHVDTEGNTIKDASLTGNVAVSAIGIYDVTIVNISGALLPSTGGIGTTIFYAAGIILMAGAVFFVVRRKKA